MSAQEKATEADLAHARKAIEQSGDIIRSQKARIEDLEMEVESLKESNQGLMDLLEKPE